MIRLVMIVKDESDVIERGLRTILPHVDDFCICDTGSTDNTKEVIRKIADEYGVPGHIYDTPWTNFGHNRSLLLRHARLQEPQVDWFYMQDADDLFIAPKSLLPTEKIRIPESLKNSACLRVSCQSKKGNAGFNDLDFWRIQFFNARRLWAFKHALHETAIVVDCGNGIISDSSFSIEVRTEGVRSKNPNKYADDAKLIEEEMTKNPKDERMQFYLAQSYRDCKDFTKARENYLKRYHMSNGGLEGERYISLNNLVGLAETMEDALKYAWMSVNINRNRREVAYMLFKRAHLSDPRTWTQELYAFGLYVEKNAKKQPHFDDLFAEREVYEWKFDFEFGNIAFVLSHHKRALHHFNKALLNAPDTDKENIRKCIEVVTSMLRADDEDM